jgi:hypothetical protein
MGCGCKGTDRPNRVNPPEVTSRRGYKTPFRIGIICSCGLMRTLPTGLKVDDIFQLVPCMRCGYAMKGLLTSTGVIEVLV